MDKSIILKNKTNNYSNALVYQIDTSNFGRISLIMKDKTIVDKASFKPFIELEHDIKISDVPKILIEYGHKNKCRTYNYLIMEYIFDVYFE